MRIFVNDFNNKTHIRNGKDSTNLKIKYYNPPDLMFQHLPVKEKGKNIKVGRKRNWEMFISLICQYRLIFVKLLKWVERLLKLTRVLFIGKIFEYHLLGTFIDKFFTLGQKYKEEGNDLMSGSVKIRLKSFYVVQMRKEINESYSCKLEYWLQT